MGLPFLKFTVMRLALFLVALVTVYWLSRSVLAAVALGAVISALLSYVLLRRPREELAEALQTRVAGRLAKPAPVSGAALRRAEDDAIEDAAADAEIARQEAARRAAVGDLPAGSEGEREPGAER